MEKRGFSDSFYKSLAKHLHGYYNDIMIRVRYAEAIAAGRRKEDSR